MATLKELIHKVIPSRGILKVPAWWMRKILDSIITDNETTKSMLVDSVSNLNDADSQLRNGKLEIAGIDIENNNICVRDGSNMIRLAVQSLEKCFAIYIKDGVSSITCFDKQYTPKNGVVYATLPNPLTSLSGLPRGDDILGFSFIGIDTSAVTEMENVFNGDTSLESLDVSMFNTSSVTSMMNLFKNCRFKDGLDLSNFDTSKVTNMYGMFEGCVTPFLDISNFDVSAKPNVSYMFNSSRVARIRCTQAIKEWILENASESRLSHPENITWEIVQ